MGEKLPIELCIDCQLRGADIPGAQLPSVCFNFILAGKLQELKPQDNLILVRAVFDQLRTAHDWQEADSEGQPPEAVIALRACLQRVGVSACDIDPSQFVDIDNIVPPNQQNPALPLENLGTH